MGCWDSNPPPKDVRNAAKLTAEVEVDGGRDLSELVLGLDLVESGVGFDDVIQLQDDHVRAFGRLGDLHKGPVVLVDGRVAPEPEDVRLRQSCELALEDESVAVILLLKRDIFKCERMKLFL